MPHMVFAGLGIEHVQQIFKNGRLRLPGDWSYEFVRNKTRRDVVVDDVNAVLEAAEKSADTHVCAATRRRGGREIANQIRAFFRFRWISEEQVVLLESGNFQNFVQVIAPVLEEELDWATQVKPTASSDCLLLPKICFRHSNGDDIWGLCEAYNDASAVPNAKKAIERFRARHWQKGKQIGKYPVEWQWIDERELAFNHRGERHATPPFPRGWKYSHQLEDGFHFDVSHRDGRAFELNDATARRARVTPGKHLNLDCHGYLR